MKTEQINEAMARLDKGFFAKYDLFNEDTVTIKRIIEEYASNYLDPVEGHGHLHRVLNGPITNKYSLYIQYLAKITQGNKATPLQMCEAILRAVEKWEDAG